MTAGAGVGTAELACPPVAFADIWPHRLRRSVPHRRLQARDRTALLEP